MDCPRDFRTDLAQSKTPSRYALASKILTRLMPGAHISQASEAEDKLGADYWLESFTRHGIDIKFRSRDCRAFGKDDLCLEIETNGQPGWAVEPSPLTSIFVWVWCDSDRYYACDSLSLSCVVRAKLSQWKRYVAKPAKTATKNGSYETTCMYVPLKELDHVLALWRRGELS